ERFLTEVAILEHFLLRFHRELADGSDVSVVEAVGSANAQLDLINAHIQQLLEFGLFLVLFVNHLLELDGILVIADEHVEVMLKDSRSLSESIIRRNAPIRPDLEEEPVVIRALADAGVFDGVADASDR